MSKLKIKLKDEYKDAIVGFNGSGEPLGQRDDLPVLAEMAVRANDKELKKYFDELPTLAEIDAAKSEAFLAAHPAPVPQPATEERVAVSTGNPAAPVVTPLKDEKPAKSKTPAQAAADDAQAANSTT